MAQALPFTKLAGLLVKTLAKPLSKRIQVEFSRYSITQRLLVGIGQTSHSLSSRMTIWSQGYRVRKITPLEPEKAMKEGAEFVGEAFILCVSGTWLVWEYNRGKDKDRNKEMEVRAKAQAERDALQAKLTTLDIRLRALESVVKYNTQSIFNISGKTYIEPQTPDMVAIDEPTERIAERKHREQQMLQQQQQQQRPATNDESTRNANDGAATSDENGTVPSQRQREETHQEKQSWWQKWRPL